MIITEPGKYRLIADFSSRNSISIIHFPCGKIIEISQVSKEYKKVIGRDFNDWHPWDLPVEIITPLDQDVEP